MSDVPASVLAFFSRDAAAIARDLVDIGLVAILIYWVLSLLKGTRAAQMAIGLSLVLVLYQAAESFGLVTVSTILDSLITYIVLIVVVIFQNDIRRALMRVGRRSMFRARKVKETQVMEEVVKAAMSLAQKRLGALIVFERDAELDEFVDRGTDLDADVSKELLYSLFIPSFENPLHDGAVVIRDGRIWQAGAFLPLAATSRQDRTLGARHRAALGISQETDAVVVVVSEERGAVSLVFNGNLVRNLDANSLRDGLHGLFYRAQPKPPPARERRPSLAPDISSDALAAVSKPGTDDEAAG